MRITVFLLLFSVVQVMGESSYSQNTRLSLNLKNVPIEEVLDEIENQSEFFFLFNHKLVNVDRKVDIDADNERIKDILADLFAGEDVNCLVLDRQILLSPKYITERINVTRDQQLQEITITGKITDEAGNSLPGANILVKGTTVGTISDFDGNYTLSVPEGATALLVSYIGFETKEVAIGGRNVIDIQLTETISELEEIVVTGYIVEKKSDLTGAVSVVDLEEVITQPVAGIDKMLQGKVPGVEVKSTGAPGGGVAIRIRGFSTIRNNDPLYIIDGVPTTTGINLLNPNDIESLQVLKDASSSTIYGSRAANGVIIITTKKGLKEKPQVSFNMYTGVQNAVNLPSMLNAQEYGDMYWQASQNDGIANVTHDIYGSGSTASIPAYIDLDGQQIIPSANTNWLDEIFNPALIQSYNLSFSHGTEKKHTLFSVSYYGQEGVLKNTDFDRITTRINSDYKLFEKLTVGENISAAYSLNTFTETNSALGSVVYEAYKMLSIAPVYNTNGEFTGYPLSDIQNPVGKLYRNKDNVQKEFRFFGNIYVQYEILEGLNFKSNLGIDYATYNFDDFSPSYEEPNALRGLNELSVINSYNRDWVWSNTVNYVKTLADKHSLNVLAGVEAIEKYFEFGSAFRNDFPLNALNTRVLSAGNAGSQLNNGDIIESSLMSYFGKINYSYDNKYLLSGTIRRDGSSKLKNNKWGTFPAFSAGWKISEEDFFDFGLINNLKLRFGWGQTGNQDVPNYVTEAGYYSNAYFSNYAIDGSQNSVTRGYSLARNANPDLKWETTTQINIGLDLALFKNRITLNMDYFNKETEGLLYEKKLPPVAGGTNQTIWDNVGVMENKGFEFDLNYKNDQSKDFRYNIGIILAIIDNELTSLDEGIDFIGIDPATLHIVNFDQETSRTVVGQSIASFYGFNVEGIFQTQTEADAYGAQPNAQAGDFKYSDINNDGVVDNDDKTFIGSPHPDFTYSIIYNCMYKNFDLSLFFVGSQGNQIYDLSRYYGDFYNLSNYNKSVRTLDAWTPQNTDTDLARLSLNDPNNNIQPSSYYVQNASYLKLRTLQIGYTLPETTLSRISIDKLRIFFEATNLFTITSYEGLDPEVGLQNYASDDRNLDIGVDRGIYPPSQTFTLGINLDF